MSTALVAVTIAVTKTTAPLPSANAPYANTKVVVTDSTGIAQSPVTLTGSETPPWTFSASVAPGAGSVTATDYDTAGAVIGTAVTQAFTEAGTPATYPSTTGITVTPTAS